MQRQIALAAAVAFVGILLVLTVLAVIHSGPDPLTILSGLVLALLGVGLFGALREPPS